jgi:hypothetical protein
VGLVVVAVTQRLAFVNAKTGPTCGEFSFFSSLVERKNIHEKRKLNCRLNQLEFHLTTVHFFFKNIKCLEGAARDRLGKSHARTKRNWHLKKGDGRKKSVHSCVCVCVAYSLLIAIVTVKK